MRLSLDIRSAFATATLRRSPLGSTRLSSNAAAASFVLSSRLDPLPSETVWHEFSPLSVDFGAVNLGQGFPDWDPPQFCIDAIHKSTLTTGEGRNANQYARSYAHMPLAKVLAEEYSQRWARHGISEIDPSTQIATATGCTNALYCALQGILSPNANDQVLLLEPSFDIYSAQVAMAGGSCVYCPLRLNEGNNGFALDMDELDQTLMENPNIKAIILNTPHNPTGKVFSRDELTAMAEVLYKYPQVLVISDEVYEHITFDPVEHESMATIPGMWERTLTLSSSGKTFACTGWKVGWAVGPPNLVQAVTAVQQWVNFSAATPTQDAIAQALVTAREPFVGKVDGQEGTYDSYYDWLAADYRNKRDCLFTALDRVGMSPIMPDGGFFIMADTSDIEFPYDTSIKTPAMPATPMPRDWALSRWMTMTVGVTAIPPSAFYSKPNVPLAANLLRFAFCKGEETILKADKRLGKYFLDE